jgi:hypothetical protein
MASKTRRPSVEGQSRRAVLGSATLAGMMSLGFPALAAAPARKGGGGVSRTYATAWRAYLAALEASRAAVEADPACKDPRVRDAALYLPTQLETAAFYMHLAPHMGYPLLNRTHVGEPIGLNWGMPNPDFDYRFTYLDGKRRYRIFGPRKSEAAFFDLIAFNGYFIDNVKTYFQGGLNRFDGPDGGIELFLGPPSKGPNHVTLDPNEPHNVLTIREALENWSVQQPTPLRIECVDPPETLGPFLYPEADLVARLQRATDLVGAATRRSLQAYKDNLAVAGGKWNAFGTQAPSEARRNNNGHPEHTMSQCIYDVPRGQSLIVEVELPSSAVYWGIQVADLFWRTTDYVWHQSSLNRKDAWVGADKVFRAVVSHEDPGVQNWLDLVDNDRGAILIRNYRAKDIRLPKTRLVPSSEVRRHLPADTPAFTPEQRRAQIAARTDGALRRFGY